MNQLFRAAKQNRIFQDVVEQIQEAIIEGHLKVGDRLPPERELKEMLQTSRSTLREALRVLEQKGLIEIKLGMGGGAVVKAAAAVKQQVAAPLAEKWGCAAEEIVFRAVEAPDSPEALTGSGPSEGDSSDG